jgi:glycosyltransferase involved in cell wall biosynthesis
VHTFDVDDALVAKLLAHPLCAAVFAHPHHVALLPPGVAPLIPVIGPDTVIPDVPKQPNFVMSVSAGLPKKQFPLLVDAFARLPEMERLIILARTNALLELPAEVAALAASRDPAIEVRVNAARTDALQSMARASAFVYTLDPKANMGFPMSIIEAMLCGTIVIAPDRPEAHAIVGEHLRTYRDVDDIVRHVRDVAAGGPAIEAARAALRERAKRHRDPVELRRLHDSLRDALTEWRFVNL